MYPFLSPHLADILLGSPNISLGPEFACNNKSLMELKYIGPTTYMRFDAELKADFAKNGSFDRRLYAKVCFLLASEINRGVEEGCFVSFRVKEEYGYVMDSPLKSAVEVMLSTEVLFEDRDEDSRGKLKGKFTLEVLYVDEDKIGEPKLLEKYVSIINTGFTNYPHSSVENYAKHAEKWFALVQNPAIGKKVNNEMKDYYELRRMYSFPRDGKCDHMFVDRWFVRYAMDTCWDIKPIYTLMLCEIYKRPSIVDRMVSSTHTMFEFLTHDGRRIVTKLRQCDKNIISQVAEEVRDQLGSKGSVGMFIVSIFAVEIPGFASAKRAQSRLNFVLQTLEKPFSAYDIGALYVYAPGEYFPIIRQKAVAVDDCKESLEKNCKCAKLHLSDYCIKKLLFHENTDTILMSRWSISPLELFDQMTSFDLFEPSGFSGDVYARAAYQLCHNNFANSFDAGTNILYEINLGPKTYFSQLRHHSHPQFEPRNLATEIFGSELIKMHKEIVVTVFVVHIFKFGPSEDPRKCLDRFNFIISNPQYTIIPPNNIGECYTILSTKTKLNTRRNRILLFTILLHTWLFGVDLDVPLLMANTCLDIANINEIAFLTRRDKQITLKLSCATAAFEVIWSNSDPWNPRALKNEILKEWDVQWEDVQEFELEVHFRGM